MKNPIYVPSGKAKEYGDYALNIYTGCPHECSYCFAPSVLRREREVFHRNVMPREGILDATRRQLAAGGITGKLIHLCFTCDPYPTGVDNSMTREIIKLLKEYGNNVQILTKGDGTRDFDLLDENDWYGITLSGLSKAHDLSAEPNAISSWERLLNLIRAKEAGIKTWVSFEPVLEPEKVIEAIKSFGTEMDKVKIGKLNYTASDIDWKNVGREIEKACIESGVDYYIKESLRTEMGKRG